MTIADLFASILPILFACSAALGNPASGSPARPLGPPAEIGSVHGVPTLIVDGAPFLILGAQCDVWRSTRQDTKVLAFFDGYQAMDATTVSAGVLWSKVEPQEGCYDFTFLDWFVRQAESRHLKLVVNLFNSNVCGKVMEWTDNAVYPQYVPDYILSQPRKYQRMVLPGPCRYVGGGPPMCPNDPATLERERRLIVRLAEHLRQCDTGRTVIMAQLDNEFYYQQWEGRRPKDEKAVRCHCSHCNRKYAAGSFRDGEDFMFRSFADYVKVLTDAFHQVYPLPLYLNSPWWNPELIPIFLDRCPNLGLVGIDGIQTPWEPNMLSKSQLGRNLPFAAENPSEDATTRFNLDVLPYYTVVGRQGIGNLLYEAHPPNTVVDDPTVRSRYQGAMIPLKHAMAPIAGSRGTEAFGGWYALRAFSEGLKVDSSGNFMPPPKGTIVHEERFFVREGKNTRIAERSPFELKIGSLTLEIAESPAGVAVAEPGGGLIIATPAGRIGVRGGRNLRATAGRFVGIRWRPEAELPVLYKNDGAHWVIPRPAVIRITTSTKGIPRGSSALRSVREWGGPGSPVRVRTCLAPRFHGLGGCSAPCGPGVLNSMASSETRPGPKSRNTTAQAR
jgi:hypothetical protein